MLANLLMSALDAKTTQIIMYVVIGVVLVLMIVMTIIPQKKRKKEQENMMNSLGVGTKVMTIGRMVGKITQINSDNTVIINVGTESSPTLIVVDKQAIGLVLENVAQPAPAQAAPAEPVKADDKAEVFEETAAKEEVVVASAPIVDEQPVEDAKEEKVEEAPKAKKTKKTADK